MSKIFAVDMDEVLSESLDEVLKFHNFLLKGKPIQRSDITTESIKIDPTMFAP